MRMRTTIVMATALVCGCYDGAGGRGVEAEPPSTRNSETQVGRLTSVGNDEYREWYDYDARGNVIQQWWRFDDRTYVARTELGFPTRAATGDEVGIVVTERAFAHRPDEAAEKVLYEHDRAGVQRRIVAERPGGARQKIVDGLHTNAIGQTTKVVYGTTEAVVSQRDYDPATLRLNSVVTKRNAETLQSLGYVFDDEGNLLARDDDRNDYDASFEYDSLDRIALMESGDAELHYGYDVRGNLTRKGDRTQTYGGERMPLHAVATSGNTTFEYDDVGNLVRTTGRDVDLEIGWNAENMPTIVRGSDDGVVYRKHFLGDSLWKKVEGATTIWYLPGVRIEKTGDTEERRIYYGSFAELDPDGAFWFHVTDHLGSASLVLDVAGEVAHRESYWAWGEERDDDEGSFDPIYTFGFKEREENTGLVDFGARLYMPETGRFASADPLTLDGPNRYAYVRNNPLTHADPSGYAAQSGQGDRSRCGDHCDPPKKRKLDADGGYTDAEGNYTIVIDETRTQELQSFLPGAGLALATGWDEADKYGGVGIFAAQRGARFFEQRRYLITASREFSWGTVTMKQPTFGRWNAPTHGWTFKTVESTRNVRIASGLGRAANFGGKILNPWVGAVADLAVGIGKMSDPTVGEIEQAEIGYGMAYEIGLGFTPLAPVAPWLGPAVGKATVQIGVWQERQMQKTGIPFEDRARYGIGTMVWY